MARNERTRPLATIKFNYFLRLLNVSGVSGRLTFGLSSDTCSRSDFHKDRYIVLPNVRSALLDPRNIKAQSVIRVYLHFSVNSSGNLTHSSSLSNLGAVRNSTTFTPNLATPSAPLHLAPITPTVHVETAPPSPAVVKATPQAAAQQLIQLSAQDEELYIEEVRPVPVLTQDLRLQQLHAIMQDHTYASQQQQQPPPQPSAASSGATTPGAAQQPQQWSLGGIGVTVAGAQTVPTVAGTYANFYGQQSEWREFFFLEIIFLIICAPCSSSPCHGRRCPFRD